MCYQLIYQYTCGCPPPPDEKATYSECPQVEGQSLEVKVQCAIKTNESRILQCNSKCLKCIKNAVAEDKARRVQKRRQSAIQEYGKAALHTYAAMLYPNSLARTAAVQSAVVQDESWALQFRLYNLAKKYGVTTRPGQKMNNTHAGVGQLTKKIEAMTLRPGARPAAEVQLVRRKMAAERERAGKVAAETLTRAMAGMQVSNANYTADAPRKRKAEEMLEETEPTKKVKGEELEIETEMDEDLDETLGADMGLGPCGVM